MICISSQKFDTFRRFWLQWTSFSGVFLSRVVMLFPVIILPQSDETMAYRLVFAGDSLWNGDVGVDPFWQFYVAFPIPTFSLKSEVTINLGICNRWGRGQMERLWRTGDDSKVKYTAIFCRRTHLFGMSVSGLLLIQRWLTYWQKPFLAGKNILWLPHGQVFASFFSCKCFLYCLSFVFVISSISMLFIL